MAIDDHPASQSLRRRKMLAAVAIIGGVSQLTALGIFAVLHQMRSLPVAVDILLGLHLLPLAGVHGKPVLRTFGWAMVAWSSACLLLNAHVGIMSAAGTVVLAAVLAVLLLSRRDKRMETR